MLGHNNDIIHNWRASERDTIRGVQIRACAVYIYIYVWRYVKQSSSACHIYVMWAELDHSHFCTVSNVVTNGNGKGTKNVLRKFLLYASLDIGPV